MNNKQQLVNWIRATLRSSGLGAVKRYLFLFDRAGSAFI